MVLMLVYFLVVPPVISEIDGGTVVNQGDNLELVCRVTGTPIPEVIWLKDGNRLHATFDSRVSFPSPGSLKIMYMRRQDAGRYSCQAQSEAGSVSDSVDVSVRGNELELLENYV